MGKVLNKVFSFFKKRPMDTTLEIPEKFISTWAALDINNNIICEYEDAAKTIEEARKVTDEFFLMFVPPKDVAYIF